MFHLCCRSMWLPQTKAIWWSFLCVPVVIENTSKMVRGLLQIAFSATQPKTTKNSEKQTSHKLGHLSRVVLLLHWVQFLAVAAAYAAISTTLMCWTSVPGLLPVSGRSAVLLWAWFGWAPFGSALWAQLGWGHSPTTPSSLAASMPVLSVQHYCGFTFLPLFSSPCLVTVFQRKQEGDELWW